MTAMKHRSISRALALSTVLAIATGSVLAGCSHEEEPKAPAASSFTPNAPVAGEPPNASPEARAQIEHMRSMGQQGGGNAAPPAGTGQ